MDKTETEKAKVTVGNLIPFDNWLKSIGRGRVTGWNWRKSGAVKVIDIFGRLYIAHSEIARFEARAANREFAGKTRVAPTGRKRKRKAVAFIDRLIGRKIQPNRSQIEA
jgi:hypothetical protein